MAEALVHIMAEGVTLYLGIIDNFGTMFGKLMLIEMLFHLWCGHQINIEREKKGRK